MFDKSKVSGLSACIPGEVEKSSPLTLGDENDDDEPDVECTKTKADAMKGLKRKAKSLSLKKKSKNPMVKIIKSMVDDVKSCNSVTSQAISGDSTHEDIMQMMALVKEAGAVEGRDEHFMATKLFVKAENRDLFLTFESPEGRLNWLKRCYDERKK